MIYLLNNDCLKSMELLYAGRFHFKAIITSPPYNMNLRVRNGKYVSRCNNKNHKSEFSTKYTNYNDDLPMEDYFQFQKTFLEKALNLADLVFYNIQMITGNKVALFKLIGYFADKIKDIIIWDKQNGQPAMHEKTLNSQFEFIIVLTKNCKPYNRTFDEAEFKRGTLTNIWSIKREPNKYIKAGFPRELVKQILGNFTRPGDFIMDPFMGSGTTGIVCKEMNRHFLGIEIDEEMFNTASKRIEEGGI